LDLANADILVDARAVLLNGQRGLHRTTNGYFLLMPLQQPLGDIQARLGGSERLVETMQMSTQFRTVIDILAGIRSQSVQITLILSCFKSALPARSELRVSPTGQSRHKGTVSALQQSRR